MGYSEEQELERYVEQCSQSRHSNRFSLYGVPMNHGCGVSSLWQVLTDLSLCLRVGIYILELFLVYNFLEFSQRDILCSLLSGRLGREKVGPAMRSAVQSQVPSLLIKLDH